MKKYKLKKDLPLAKAGTEVYIERFIENESIAFKIFKSSNDVKLSIAIIEEHNIDIWLEEIKEKPKSIFDLKKGDTYYYINHYGKIQECRYVHEENLNIIINNGKSYISYEEAQKELEKRKIIIKIKKYCYRSGIDNSFRNGKYCFFRRWNGEVHFLNFENCYLSPIGYFYYEDAKKILENFEEDLKFLFDNY